MLKKQARGAEAAKMGLVLESVPAQKLDDRALELAQRISGVPKNQLIMQPGFSRERLTCCFTAIDFDLLVERCPSQG